MSDRQSLTFFTYLINSERGHLSVHDDDFRVILDRHMEVINTFVTITCNPKLVQGIHNKIEGDVLRFLWDQGFEGVSASHFVWLIELNLWNLYKSSDPFPFPVEPDPSCGLQSKRFKEFRQQKLIDNAYENRQQGMLITLNNTAAAWANVIYTRLKAEARAGTTTAPVSKV